MKNFKYTISSKHKGFNFKNLKYGTWALQAVEYGLLSTIHMDYIKLYLQKIIKKFKNFKFNITLNKLNTKKPLETRMGGGKGSIKGQQCFVKPGSIILEMFDLNSNMIFYISRVINNKIPLKMKLININ